MDARPSLLWFRQALRLADNPVLEAAMTRGGPVIPVFILDSGEEGEWRPGPASSTWLTESLTSLDHDLRERGSRLILRRGLAGEALLALTRECDARAVFFDRRYEPAASVSERDIERMLITRGIEVVSANASLLVEPDRIATEAGGPYRVFTPFHRAWQRIAIGESPRPVPRMMPAPVRWPVRDVRIEVDACARGRLIRDGGWKPGERGALERLRAFVKASLTGYPNDRDRPGIGGTSRLSPHLHFGEIGPRQIADAVQTRAAGSSAPGEMRAAEAYLRQLAWREFAVHVLHHHPHTTDRPLRPEFAAFPWSRGRAGLEAWKRGETGYPVVDAGMRELLGTGWMHNRVRMIAASFLTKDLRVPWLAGARWFWEKLIDADLANNTFGWQWTAGCGADAAPYFRIFNPVLQGMRYDAQGVYVRRWIPELSRLPDRWIHRPFEAPADALAQAGVRLGRDYPKPIVDHARAREEALLAIASIAGGRRKAPRGGRRSGRHPAH